ncbi:glycosyltransferase family 4 protein [Flavobacterium sp.]|uniref:glycosyltransferase family 4 protein n=1 Tax=Flavobacterium sp. TaxID=239 RepID=UPI00375392CF
MKKLIRTATVSVSLDVLLKGQLAFLNEHYQVIAVSGKDKNLENVSIREGVRIENVPMYRTITPFKDFGSLIKLYLLFKKEKPLIVHSITPKAGLLSMIAAYFAGVPIRIHTFTGLLFPYKTGILHHVLLFMDRILCLFATTIFPEGKGVQNDLLRFKVTKKPLTIIANGNVNGIDTNYFNATLILQSEKEKLQHNLKISTNDFVFVFVGRLVADKGINELIEAFDDLSKANNNCKLLLVGALENDLDPLNETTLNTIKDNKAILSVGFQTDIRPYLAISTAFVFPSYREGFPNVILQAGAMNLPCIVTDISGCNEIILPNENGIIIPIKNKIAIFDGMIAIMTNDLLRNKCKQNARNLIVSRYQQDKVWQALLTQYIKLEQTYS